MGQDSYDRRVGTGELDQRVGLRASGSSIGSCFCSAPPALDAFYGEALNIESRTDEWSEKL